MVSLGVTPILTSCQKFNLLATLSALSANATEQDNYLRQSPHIQEKKIQIHNNDNKTSGPTIFRNPLAFSSKSVTATGLSIKEMVPCNNSLLVLAGKSLQPYNKICVKYSFEGVVKPNGLIKGRALSRRLLLWVSNEGQSSKKCSSSSRPSFDGHIASSASLKLCFNLWRFSLLKLTLNWVR